MRRSAWPPPCAPVTATTNPTYDDDGNLDNDGRWTYVWDAENRLVKLETTPAAIAAGQAPTRLVFAYDSQSRRISRSVFEGADYATLASSKRWLYDGNGNIIAWTAPGANAPVHRREYAPFGDTTVSEGISPSSFAFSTKMEDPATGLHYKVTDKM